MKSSQINLPLILTLSRLLIAPILLPFLFIWLLPYNNILINVMLAIVFILFSLTDFFDGYLARKFKQVTVLGRMLDPIADKLFVISTLIALLAVQKIWVGWVLILILREVFIMGLRQIANERQIVIHVSLYGKLKTAAQLLMLIVIIINPHTSCAILLTCLELTLIMSAIIFSIASAYFYTYSYLSLILQKEY